MYADRMDFQLRDAITHLRKVENSLRTHLSEEQRKELEGAIDSVIIASLRKKELLNDEGATKWAPTHNINTN